MTNRICGKCRSRKVVDAGSYAGSSFYKCEDCGQLGMCEKFPKMTIFHQITASPEVLAPHFVFLKALFVTNINPQQQWISTLTEEVYPTKAEAIAATVERLKEVEK